jgi:protein phosphatase
VPLARFGHTISLVANNKVVLFGGATGDTGKYVITSDTYSLDLSTSKWKKIEGGGISPSPRAAHASTSIDAL